MDVERGGGKLEAGCGMLSEDTKDRFGGVARLYGERVLARLVAARVVVVGIGGVGSWTVEALARSGVGKIRMVDLDEICVTNVNRQLHAMDGQIGRQKTAAMAERVRLINPGCELEVIEGFFTERSVEEVLGGEIDGVVDAIDSMQHKALLLAECRRRGIPVVTCGGAGGKRDATRIIVRDLAFSGKDALLHGLRKKLRKEHGFPKVEMGQKPDEMGIAAVFSDEPPIYPGADGEVSCERPEGADVRLNCASGYGTAAHMTGAFGLAAAGAMLDLLEQDLRS
ncbi:ThiF family adenylyltransferase [Luteolibacter sp. AS25]|uniref:tRNA threonylcarbamoyladenosine dehydratase n=1 Tax=Luteolibacter sp. AS25 TaxID=3135776 RepID=UPI00398AA845